MSARRQARANVKATSDDMIPGCLLIGRCIDVWADPTAAVPSASARARFNAVRDWWIADHEHDQIPAGAPWTVEFLTYRGQAKRIGRTATEVAAERLARAGPNATVPALAVEAQRLLNRTDQTSSRS